MCGIAGWIDWDSDLTREGPVVDRMAETLELRGPDAKGTYTSLHAALAHRRLIVIDPEGGEQPMVHEDGERRYVTVYNGEIYNFMELRAELERAGRRFRTRSDTEVLLQAYAEWGPDCVKRLNGIFAFAIWDESRQRLFLARDQMGVKPLYWARRGNAILFGSELKALLAHPLVAPEVDRQGLGELLLTVPVFPSTPGTTPFRGIKELAPAHRISFERDRTEESEYWSLVSAPHTDDLETTIARLKEMLAAIVRRQLVSDVPIACLLSGGLDSSAITALAVPELRRSNKPVHTWALDFVGSEEFITHAMISSRDAPFAAEVAAHVGSEHHLVVLETRPMLDHLLEAMRARDLPISLQVDTSMLLLLRQVKTGATVTMSGEAGDETFAGYPWQNAGGDQPRDRTFPWAPSHAPWPFAFTRDLIEELRPEQLIEQRYQEALAKVPLLPGEDPSAAAQRKTDFLTLRHFLPDLLDRNDRISMAAGIEARVPFCDPELVQYLWNVPHAFKRTGAIEKGLLRRVLEDLLPKSVLQRKKSAFPQLQHQSYYRGLIERALEILGEGTSPALQLYDGEKLRDLCDGTVPPEGWLFQPPRAIVQLERLVQMDAWLREYRVSFV